MSDENKNLQNEEINTSADELPVAEIAEDISNNDLPPLDIKLSDSPEEKRELVNENLKDAEESISLELKGPELEDSQENDDVDDKVIKHIKRQNAVLKFICICLVACTAVNVFLGMPKVNKSNVHINNSDINRIILNNTNHPGNVLTASQIYNENIDSVVAIHTEMVTQSIFGDYASASSGSGFIISEDGYILTNYHVVEGATTINVTMSNGNEYQAELVGYEVDNDIAVLKISSEVKLNPVTFGKSDNLIIGEDVVAIGNPLGELTFSITKGIVSAVDRNIQIDTYNTIGMFQVDCAVNQGNSGGPIFNAAGEVVGIVSAKYASELIEGLGFCIPIDDVVSILPDLVEHGKVMNKAYMGVAVVDISEQMITQYSMVPGAYISSIDAGSCAEKAGLKIGDIVVMMGDSEVSNVSELLLAKRGYKAGQTTSLKVWRSGEYVDLTITFDKYVEPEVEDTPTIENVPQNVYPQNPGQDFSMEDFLWEYFYNNR